MIVKIDLACICASDLAEYRDGPHVIPVDRPHRLTGQKAPVTLGHEFVGKVTATGAAVDDLTLGDRVCGDACLRCCGSCFWCQRGEYDICEFGGSGATDVLAPGKELRGAIKALTGGRGADLVCDCTGLAAVLPSSVELSRRGGRIVVCGIAHEPSHVRADRIVYFEREVIGSLGYRRTHEPVLRLLETGRLDVGWLLAEPIELERVVAEGLDVMGSPSNAAWLRIPVVMTGA